MRIARPFFSFCVIFLTLLVSFVAHQLTSSAQDRQYSKEEVQKYASEVTYFLNMFGVECADHVLPSASIPGIDLRGMEFWLVDAGDGSAGYAPRVWRWLAPEESAFAEISDVELNEPQSRAEIEVLLATSISDATEVQRRLNDLFRGTYSIFTLDVSGEEQVIMSLNLRRDMGVTGKSKIWGDNHIYYNAAWAASHLPYRLIQQRAGGHLELPRFPQRGAFRGMIYPQEHEPMYFILMTRDALRESALARAAGDAEEAERYLKDAKYWYTRFQNYGADAKGVETAQGELYLGFRRYAITQGLPAAFQSAAINIAMAGGCADASSNELLATHAEKMPHHFVGEHYGFLGIWNDAGIAVDPLARLHVGRDWVGRVLETPASTPLDVLLAEVEITEDYRAEDNHRVLTQSREAAGQRNMDFTALLEPQLDRLKSTDYVRLSLGSRYTDPRRWTYIFDIVGDSKPEGFSNLTFWYPTGPYTYQIVDGNGDKQTDIKLKAEVEALVASDADLFGAVRNTMSALVTRDDPCNADFDDPEVLRSNRSPNFILLMHRDHIKLTSDKTRLTINNHPHLQGEAIVRQVHESAEAGGVTWLCLDPA